MSTYLEVVIQERSTDGRSILTHRHIMIQHPNASALAHETALSVQRAANALNFPVETSDPMRPCSLCWQIGKDSTHDP